MMITLKITRKKDCGGGRYVDVRLVSGRMRISSVFGTEWTRVESERGFGEYLLRINGRASHSIRAEKRSEEY